MDATGNLFIADLFNNAIRKVDTNGLITTVAGGGADYLGDGGAATSAELASPEGVAVDATGNLFIADSQDNRIRKVDTNGIITTVVGNGIANYSGDGGAATNAELAWPEGVAVDATGNLFIADEVNNAIRKVDTNGLITTVAGNGYGAGTLVGGYSGDGGAATNAELNDPFGVAVDATGNLFIADSGNNVIREVGTNGIITTVAGNGYGAGDGVYSEDGAYSGDGSAAIDAELNGPFGVMLDATGNLFIADTENNRIRKVVNPGFISSAIVNTGFISGPILTLDDVGVSNAGTYDVIVSSPYGSVTSSVVNLTVTLPAQSLRLASAGFSTNNGFQVSIYGQIGQAYTLQASTNLVNWVSISNFTCTNSPVYVVDPAAKNFSHRFYRVAHGTLAIPVSPLVLGFKSPYPWTTNGLALMLQGPVGSNYVIQASTNLLTWLSITNFVSTNSPVYFDDPLATNCSRRFYRAVIP